MKDVLGLASYLCSGCSIPNYYPTTITTNETATALSTSPTIKLVVYGLLFRSEGRRVLRRQRIGHHHTLAQIRTHQHTSAIVSRGFSLEALCSFDPKPNSPKKLKVSARPEPPRRTTLRKNSMAYLLVMV